MEIVVKVERLPEAKEINLPLPKYAHPYDAGLDLRSRITTTLLPGERKLIPTGIKVAIPPGYVGIVKDRSSMALKYGVHTIAGVIDSGYRGEIGVVILNTDKEKFTIHKGDRIAQLLILPVMLVKLEEDTLTETPRGEKGWGSSGKR